MNSIHNDQNELAQLFNVANQPPVVSTIYQSQVASTIYVTDLPKNTSYFDLYEIYDRKIGPCDIIIKRPVFKHFYYAYVIFKDPAHATKAIEQYRYPTIKGCVARSLPYTFKYTKYQSSDETCNTSIFVKGLQKLKWTHKDLHNAFEKYGKIISAKLSLDKDHNCVGYGFVQFESKEQVIKAIEEMNGKEIDGNKLSITIFDSEKKKASAVQAVVKGFTNLYVKNFPEQSYEDADLMILFSKYGKITSACVMKDENNKSKGFGFVCFQNPQDAKKAVDELHKYPDGLYVAEAKTKHQREVELQKKSFSFKKSLQHLNLFVKGYDVETTKQEDLETYFKSFGVVKNLKMHPNGYTFVGYLDRDSAKRALQATNGQRWSGRYIKVNFFEPKEIRQLQLEESLDKREFEKRKQMELMNSSKVLGDNSNNLIGVVENLVKMTQNLNLNPIINALTQNRSNSYQRQQPRRNTNQQRNTYQNNQYGNQYAQNGRQQQMQQPVMNQVPFVQPIPFSQIYPYTQQMVYNQMVAQPSTMGIMQNPSFQNTAYQPTTRPQLNNSQSIQFYNQIQALFRSDEFKASDIKGRKDLIGNQIYETIEKLAGVERAPKITGMIIDLPESELNQAVFTYENLEMKIKAALTLLQELEHQQLKKQ